MRSVRRPRRRKARKARPLTTLFALVVVTSGSLGAPLGRPDPAAAVVATPLMREARVTAEEIASWARLRSPGDHRLTVPLEQLITLFLDEGEAQGVAGDLAFAQAVLETGWFRFHGSMVRPADNNFGGIGANGVPGDVASFPTAEIGVRAQIQHLWAYADPTASADTAARPLVDPRFDLVTPKGTAPTWEEMGDGRWATDPDYGPKVLALYDELLELTRVGRWITAAYDDVLDRAPGATERDWWVDATGTRGRAWVARMLTRSPEGISAWVRGRYLHLLGRTPTPEELASWTSSVRAGRSLSGLVAALAGSDEALHRAGGAADAWVDGLYRTVLGRAAEPSAVRHWVDRLEGGTARESVVRSVWGSIKSRRVRVRALYLAVLDRTAEPAGLTWHADRLATSDDLALTADLVASGERYLLAQA